MIGRSTPTKDISQAQIQENASSTLSNKDNQTQLDKIKSNLDSTLQTASVKDEILNVKIEKPKSFVKRLEQERANKTTEKQR
jgi:hypothetical protein